MQLTVKGQHLDVGDSLREHVRENLTHNAGKYFNNPIESTVIFTKEKNHLYRVDISIHVGQGIVLQAENHADDPYIAFDGASHRVVKRLAKYKDKLRDHHRKENTIDMHMGAYTTFQGGETDADAGPATIAEMQASIPTLAVSDAVMRLELGSLPALMFKNPAHGGFNMVYRRKDGHIGWVDPDGNQQSAKKQELAQKQTQVRKTPPAKKRPVQKKAAVQKKPLKLAPARKKATKKAGRK